MRPTIIIEKPKLSITPGASPVYDTNIQPVPSFLQKQTFSPDIHFETTVKPVTDFHFNSITKDLIMAKNKITLYGCGGAGINIASMFEKTVGTSNPGFADINPIYIDTSHSNIGINIPQERTYLIEGLDGSGKIRRENHLAIADCIHDILLTHKPGNLSIIVSSTSGGKPTVEKL